MYINSVLLSAYILQSFEKYFYVIIFISFINIFTIL
jgi:hypothetical protein